MSILLASFLLWQTTANIADASGSTRCAVVAQPRVALAPVRYLRIKTQVDASEADRFARLVLVDADGEVTSSQLQLDARTHWVEWKNVVLGPGQYEVVLAVFNDLGKQTCLARTAIT